VFTKISTYSVAEIKRKMKRSLFISILAVIMVSCLQGYNIYLQYHSYIEAEFTKINPIIYQSIDEELNIRTRITKNPDKIGSQHSYLKVYEPGETAPKLDKGEKIRQVLNRSAKI
jgi:hypothetical protein